MQIVDIGKDFYHRLVNRDKYQGDGQHNAEDFRNKYFKQFDNSDCWKKEGVLVELDFESVVKIGPSFANEAFAYFMKYTNPENFKKKIVFRNISRVMNALVETELKTGYSKR